MLDMGDSTATRISLGADADGVPLVIWDCHVQPHGRSLTDSDMTETDRKNLISFVNKRNAETFLRGLERFSFPPLHTAIGANRIQITKPSPRNVLEALGIRDTPAQRRQAANAIETWSYPFDQFSLFLALPLEELAQMAHDLKAAFSLLAFVAGECSIENMRKNLGNALYWRSDDAGRSYRDYADALLGKSESFARFFDARALPALALGHGEPNEKSDIRAVEGYAVSIFNLFMSDSSPCIFPDGKASTNLTFGFSNESKLGTAYAELGKALCDGKAAVCERCGAVFLRRRNTRKYCSDACNTLANRKKRGGAR